MKDPNWLFRFGQPTCTVQSTCLPGPSWKGWIPIPGLGILSPGCADELAHSRGSSFQAAKEVCFLFHLYLYFCKNLAAKVLFHRTTPIWVLLSPTAAPAILAPTVLQQLVLPKGALSFPTAGELGACESWSSLLLVMRHNYKQFPLAMTNKEIQIRKNLMIRWFPSSVEPSACFAMSAQRLSVGQPGLVGSKQWVITCQSQPSGFAWKDFHFWWICSYHDNGTYHQDLDVVWHL